MASPRPALLFVGLLLASASPAGVIGPNFWTVGTGISCEFSSIQAGIDAAAAAPGAQTLFVTRSATYASQALVIADADALTLAGGYANCLLDPPSGTTALGGAAGHAVLRIVGAGNVVLSRLDISGGTGTQISGSPPHGGGILHTGGGLLTLIDSVVHDNTSSFGSGIAVEGSGSLDLVASVVSHNARGSTHGPRSVAGVWFDSTGFLLIEADSVLEQNAERGVYLQSASSAELRDSIVRDNDAAGFSGPGIDITANGPVQVHRVLVSDDYGGGLYYAGSGGLTITGSTFAGNGRTASDVSGTQGGGGLDLGGSGDVGISTSHIVGNRSDAVGSGGGGIRFTGSGRLSIDSTQITGNGAPNGAGLYADGSGIDPRPVIAFGDDVLVTENTADVELATNLGGGIFARAIELDLRDAPRHRIAGNRADMGGGIYLAAASAWIGSGDELGNIVDNEAADQGGGVFATESAQLSLYTSVPEAPVALLRNAAAAAGGGYGGALVVYSPAAGAVPTRVFAYDARIEQNSAPNGGGVAVLSFDEGDAHFCMGRSQEPDSCASLGGTLPAGAVSCEPEGSCNTLIANQSTGILGGAALLRATASAGAPRIHVAGAIIRGNVGRSTIGSMASPAVPPPAGLLSLHDSVMTGNSASNALIDGAPPGAAGFPPESAFALGGVEIARSSIAGNAIGAASVINTRINLGLVESIVHQPGTSVHAGNASGVFARSVLAHEIASLPPRADVVAADPLFVDVDAGDLRLGAGSPALDFSDYGDGGFDLQGTARGQDLPNVPDRFGTRDLGAFEQDTDALFANGFE